MRNLRLLVSLFGLGLLAGKKRLQTAFSAI